jgi:cation-transporting P-type ATPase 13A2
MATGDNVLTAISVGRECNIIDAACEVFLGDVKKVKGKETVVWRSTKNTKRTLNKNTLTPIAGEEDIKKSDLKNSQFNSLKMSRNQNEISVNDLVDLDIENPWLHPPENYGVAITGKAFDILVNDPNSKPILKKVLLKA